MPLDNLVTLMCTGLRFYISNESTDAFFACLLKRLMVRYSLKHWSQYCDLPIYNILLYFERENKISQGKYNEVADD